MIMAGGSGERFWPLSTKENPKQLLNLIDSERSLIRMTVDRVLPMVPAERIFIATNQIQAKGIRDALDMISNENIIIEPAFRDTAAAIGHACIVISEVFPDSTMVVLASDHLIRDEQEFRNNLKTAIELAENSEAIVTLGIKPDKPETGYGYLETQESIIGSPTKVLRFCEKPNIEKAKEYLKSGKFLWNSGMFIFKVGTMFRAFEEYMPDHWSVLLSIRELRNKKNEGTIAEQDFNIQLKALFEKFVKISIDYGIMEKYPKTYVIPVDFGWNDIGSFTALAEVFAPDENGNIIRNAKVKEYKTKGNIVIGFSSPNKTIALLGVEDIIVVDTPDAILVCTKKEAQNIKKIL